MPKTKFKISFHLGLQNEMFERCVRLIDLILLTICFKWILPFHICILSHFFAILLVTLTFKVSILWADLMAAQGAFGTYFYGRSILRLKYRAYYRSGRLVIKISPKGALGSHEIRPIHSAPSLGQSIQTCTRTR